MSDYKEIGERVFNISIISDAEIEKSNKLRAEKYPEWEETKKIKITEGCDNYFCEYYHKQEAIALFKEIINWIEENA